MSPSSGYGSLHVMLDTSPAAAARYRALLAGLSPVKRLEMCGRLTAASRAMAVAGIRRDDPNASPLEIRARLAERLYGVEVRRRLFPDVR